MGQEHSGGSHSPPKDYTNLFDRLLGRARGMSEETRKRLRVLNEHFPEVLPQEVFEGGESGDAPVEERRAAPRCGGGQARVIVFAVASQEIVMARVGDWSACGVRLWLSRPLEVGRSVYLLPEDYPEAAAGALAEVRYCRPDGEGWTVGCRLVRSGLPPEQMFGNHPS